MNDTLYTTPEGFVLHKQLLLPDAHDFTDLLTAERRWDFATMNHYNGYPQADTPEEITDNTRPYGDRPVSRFLSVNQFPGHYHLQITPTERLLEVLWSDVVVFFTRIELSAIYHESNDRVLLTASATNIIASRWIAYLDPATVPTMEA